MPTSQCLRLLVDTKFRIFFVRFRAHHSHQSSAGFGRILTASEFNTFLTRKALTSNKVLYG